jgi:DNA-binding NarL/FixJ family response regulator
MVRVLLVDHDALVRADLKIILSSAEDADVVGEPTMAPERSPRCGTTSPMSCSWTSGWRRWTASPRPRHCARLTPAPHVIVLTTFQADEHLVGALRAGASGFLVKDTPPLDIINAIRLVAAGEAIISPSATRTLLAHFGDTQATARREAAAARLASLTDRELDVAMAIASGASNADVAAQLFMSEATVNAHVSSLLTKLQVNNRVQIAILVHDASTS